MIFEYKARIAEVVSGNTIEASLDLGFGVTKYLPLTLAGIDPASTGLDALAYIYGWLHENNWNAKIRVYKKKSEYVAYVFPVDLEDESVTLNSDLIEGDYAIGS